MGQRNLGIIVNGVTGRMGSNQHLVDSILAIRNQGGIELEDGTRLFPDPVLVGRNEDKLRLLASEHGLKRWTTDLDACLGDSSLPIYFDVQTTSVRPRAIEAAINAGKHVYCEKPLAGDFETAIGLARQAEKAGIKTGVVQDKLFLPGMMKLAQLVSDGFFGRILSVRGEFGYWVFEGNDRPLQRPSWNYRADEGGGIILDMFPHWHYLVENLFGPIRSVSALGAIHIPVRFDEAGAQYEVTADDSAYATFQLDEGIVVTINSSWATRVYRDELVVFQVDGSHGSAVAGLRDCRVQTRADTPRPVWSPDNPSAIDFRAGWSETMGDLAYENAFKAQWELFIRHVVNDDPFIWDFLSAAKGVLLADIAHRSCKEKRWIDVPEVGL